MITFRRNLPSPSLGPSLNMEAAYSSEILVIISTRPHGVVCFTLKMDEECWYDKVYRVFE
jgi:hypothetical protein